MEIQRYTGQDRYVYVKKKNMEVRRKKALIRKEEEKGGE